MRRFWIFPAAAILVVAAIGHADQPVPQVTPWKPPIKKPVGLSSTAVASPAVSTTPAPKVAWKPAPPKPKLPPPAIELAVDPRTYGTWWMMEVRNVGEIPLSIVADARLLRLEITAPADPSSKGKPKTITCDLPSSMRSSERTLVLPAHARYLEAFDPRLYCLGNTKELVDGATVVARLGWKPNDLSPPYVVSPSLADDKSKIASAKELVASELVIDRSKAKGNTPPPVGAPLVPIVVKGGAARSAYDGANASIHLSLVNEDSVAHAIYARPQLVGARVRNPRGTITICGTWATSIAPIADFIAHLKPKGSWGATVSAADLCPPKTFDYPGLYEITPFINAPALPKTNGAISGMLSAGEPELLRIEVGDHPFHDVPPMALLTSE